MVALPNIWCGSGLARDSIAVVHLPDRVACIAGKPAPTGQAWPTESTACQDPLWERACSRGHRCGVPARPRRLHRRQASSHRSGMASRIRGWPGPFVGAGLLAMASPWCTCQTASPASQASQLPQVRHGQLNPRLARTLCGSGLAREGIAAVYLPDRVACIAGKPAPPGQAWPAEFAAGQGPLWERACSRGHRCGVPARPRRPHRRQASSHRSGMASSHMKRRRTLSQTCYHSATFLSYPPAILTPLLRTRGYERPVCQHAHDTPNLVNVSP